MHTKKQRSMSNVETGIFVFTNFASTLVLRQVTMKRIVCTIGWAERLGLRSGQNNRDMANGRGWIGV